MTKNGDDDVDSVGYGRPPRHTRFKPGQSGNPTGGRSRRGPTLGDDVLAELGAPFVVEEDGQTIRMTRQRAIARMLIGKAVSGDLRAATLILAYCAALTGQPGSDGGPSHPESQSEEPEIGPHDDEAEAVSAFAVEKFKRLPPPSTNETEE